MSDDLLLRLDRIEETLIILCEHLGIKDAPVSKTRVLMPLLRKPVNILHLSTRPRNLLENQGLSQIGDLVHMKRGELLRLPECGKITVREIEDKLQVYDLGLGMYVPEWFQELHQ